MPIDQCLFQSLNEIKSAFIESSPNNKSIAIDEWEAINSADSSSADSSYADSSPKSL
jgi:hypothetical protein